MKIRIAGIVKNSSVDGKGIRYVVFTQGCKHNCKGCHNKHTHGINGGKLVDIEEIIMDIKADRIIDGITLSGGEPMLQADKCIEIAKAAKEAGLNVWTYTGYKIEDLLCYESEKSKGKGVNKDMKNLLSYIDVLVDGPFMESELDMSGKFRGSKNQRFIDVKETLRTGRAVEIEYWRQ